MSDGPLRGGGVDLRLVPAAAGCWAASALAVGGEPRTVAWAAGLCAGSALLLASVRPVRRGRTGRGTVEVPRLVTPASLWLPIALVALTLASCAVQLGTRSAGLLGALAAEHAAVEVVGVVRSEVRPQTGRWGTGSGTTVRTVLAVEEAAGRGKVGTVQAPVAVLGGPQWSAVPYGARVRAGGVLAAAPAPDRAPVLTSPRVDVLSGPGAVEAAVGGLRDGLLAATADLPPDTRGLVPGAAFGDTSRVPADLGQAMKDAGLTHITAVSGGHFVILSVTVLAGTAVVRMPRAARVGTTAAVLGAFVLLVHPEPSVVRAAGMGGIAMLGLLLGRPAQGLPALAATVVVLVTLDPWLARSLGFILSVVATGAILLLAPPLAGLVEGLLPRGLALVLAAPVAAQSVCAPVLLLVEPSVSAYAVAANVLAAPAVAPATLLGLAATVTLPWCEPLGDVLVQGAAWASWWIAWVARTTAALPGARVAWPGGAGGAALLAVLTAAVLTALLRRPARAGGRATQAAGGA